MKSCEKNNIVLREIYTVEIFANEENQTEELSVALLATTCSTSQEEKEGKMHKKLQNISRPKNKQIFTKLTRKSAF